MSEAMQNIYISNIDINEAKNAYYNRLGDFDPGFEELKVTQSLGRVTYNCVYAAISSPYFNSAAMDGIAVKAEDTYNASEVKPVILAEGRDFDYINTGNILKNPYNSVIMIEDVIDIGKGEIKIIGPAHPWQHIRLVGEDIAAGEMIIPSNHIIRPVDLGAIISAGIDKVRVCRKPRVGIIPTGSELVDSLSLLGEGKIIESNSRVFEGLVKQYGGISERYDPVRDEIDDLRKAFIMGVKENDILIINAGSSAGARDFTADVIRELGEVVIHGLALKPGKPTILGIIDKKPVIGIPGYPVSSFLVFESLVKPIILKYSRLEREKSAENNKTIRAVLSRRIVSSFKHQEFVRATVGYIKGRYVATPLMRGAGAAMSLVRADGIFEVPRNSEGLEAGEELDVRLYKPEELLKKTLLSIGSHDMIMDEISDMMDLASAHTGSMGGITAMKRNECHIAPIHLLDEHTGRYNISYIERHFPGKNMVLIKGLKRLQGFMVQKGNPAGIRGFDSLVKDGVTYVNRQKGSGTRILLDYNLRKIKLDPGKISGYEKEMTTHMAVAAAVAGGTAVTGLGVLSAARGTGLDFIPVGYEEYDFLTTLEFMEDERVKVFIDVIRSEEFNKRVNRLGGYEMSETGRTIIIGKH